MAITVRTFLSASVNVWCIYFLNKSQGNAAKICDTKPQILINQFKCFEFSKDIEVTISQFLTKDVTFIRETELHA